MSKEKSNTQRKSEPARPMQNQQKRQQAKPQDQRQTLPAVGERQGRREQQNGSR